MKSSSLLFVCAVVTAVFAYSFIAESQSVVSKTGGLTDTIAVGASCEGKKSTKTTSACSLTGNVPIPKDFIPMEVNGSIIYIANGCTTQVRLYCASQNAIWPDGEAGGVNVSANPSANCSGSYTPSTGSDVLWTYRDGDGEVLFTETRCVITPGATQSCGKKNAVTGC